jgi:hypothetical protein
MKEKEPVAMKEKEPEEPVAIWHSRWQHWELAFGWKRLEFTWRGWWHWKDWEYQGDSYYGFLTLYLGPVILYLRW